MATIITVRPSATSSSTGWSAVGAASLHAATSDDSDASYALWSGAGAPLVLQTAPDAPPSGQRRHQTRVRIRGEDGDVAWAVRLQSGALTATASATLDTSPETVTGSWGFGAPPDVSTALAAHILGQTTNLRIIEVYLDIDFRDPPELTPEVIDGSGASVTTVTDTATPTLRASSLVLDDLPAREYRYWVTSGADVVFDTGVVSGDPADTTTTPLENGSYTAHFQIWTTVGGAYAYASDEETLAFTVAVGVVQEPADPVVTPVSGTPFFSVEVCAPNVTSFDDGAGYVELQRVGCASSDSPTATTIAMVGPLETDECGTWVDYSFPRTGLGADCTHEAEQCCAYYRARTVGRIDGLIVISAWSDVTDTGIPSGLIFLWPSTAASIPAGWSRVTDLDSRYPKGAADGVQPGTMGGAASHSHTLPTHTHDETHSHTVTGNTSAGVGSIGSTDGAAGTTAIASSHTHTRPAVNSEAVVSGGTAPGTVVTDNDQSRLMVIWIESDGTPTGVPDGALGLAPDVSITGWTDFVTATSRYLKGAPAAGDGGGTGASALSNHTHSIDSHTHTGTSHLHNSSNTGTNNSNISLFAGPNAVLWTASHSHPITIGSTATAALASASGGTSDASSDAATEPPFINTRVKQNTSGSASIPVGIVGLWRGSLGTIPENFALCDGTNGTLDMRGRYPKGATSSIGTTGGSAVGHTHTSPTHTHTTSGHTHTETIGSAAAATANVSATSTVTVSLGTHTHTGTATNSATPTVGASTPGTLQTQTSEPLHQEVAFVQLVEPLTPEAEPEVFCLEWDSDEHLLRTEGPDGPLWAPVAGKFEWNVDRPFSSAFGVNGTRFVTSAAPGGRNLNMIAAVESEEELETLQEVLGRPLVLISPSDSTEVWGAPIAESVRVVRIGRIRQVTASFIGTGPQPGPQVDDL